MDQWEKEKAKSWTKLSREKNLAEKAAISANPLAPYFLEDSKPMS